MTIKKNIEISVESSTRKVFFEDNFLGLTGENLQGYVVFSFKDRFVSGVPRVEIIQGSNKYIITDMETEDETYKLLIKSSLLTTSNVQMQLVITESAERDSIPIFKSKMFSLYVAESINAETTIPEEYAAWIDTANAKIAEINQKLEDVDTALQNAETATSGAEKVNISSSKSGKTTTVITTNRNGVETTNEVLDGNDGEDGEDGIGLQFMWQGTSLGVKRENDSEYVFVDLQGIEGKKGDTGAPFTIKKTYSSVAAMQADFNNMEYGDYVMIATSVEIEDNAKLYTRGENEWIFITDFSGSMGIKGDVGLTPNIQIGTVTSGDTPSVTRTGTNEEPILNFVLQPGPKGNTGEQGLTGNGIANITKTSTSGLVDTYTITYTNGSTTTFNVNNGKGIVSITKVLSQDNIDTYRITYNDNTYFEYQIENGSVTQTQYDELEDRVHDLERNQKTDEATGTEIDLTDAFDTRPRYLGIDATETTQGENPSPDNPQDVETMAGYRNLFDINSKDINASAVSEEVINNELVLTATSKNTAYCGFYIRNIKPNTQYTFSYIAKADYYAGYQLRSYNSSNVNTVLSTASGSNISYKFTTPNDSSYLLIFLYASNNSNVTVGQKTIYSKVQLTEGTEEKPYVPYGTNYMLLDEVGKNYINVNNLNLYNNGWCFYISNPFKKSGTYTYSFGDTSYLGNTSHYFSLKFGDDYTQQSSQQLMGTPCNMPTSSFDITNEMVLKKYLLLYGNANNLLPYIKDSKFMVAEASATIEYEPYQHKQYPISLANQELLNKNNYVDKIIVDESTGQRYIDKRWGKVVLDGSETYIYESSNGRFYTQLSFSYDTTIRSQFPCNLYINGDSTKSGYFGTNAGGRLLYFHTPDSSITTANDFKSWLKEKYDNGTPLIVYYVLATPQLIPIDNPNIKLLNGVNHITNSEGAEMDIVYVKDINAYLDSINARLEALENANQGE